jgi:hypothetical protein
VSLTVEFCQGQIEALEHEIAEHLKIIHRAEGGIIALRMIVQRLGAEADATDGVVGEQ